MILSDALPHCDTILPLQQSPEFAQTLQHMGRKADFITISHNNRRLAHLVVMRRRILGAKVAFTSRGPVWPTPPNFEMRCRMIERLRQAGLTAINATAKDVQALKITGYTQVMTPATLAQLDLTADWRSHATVKWRNGLTRAERDRIDANLTLTNRRFDPRQDDWLLQQTTAQARARRYRDLPASFTRAYTAVNPGQAQIFIAQQQDTPISAILILRHHGGATYHLGWSNDAGRRVDAHRLLLARAADWLVERQHRRLDLGTIDTETAPGLARFKLGMGARAVELGGTWLKMPRLLSTPVFGDK